MLRTRVGISVLVLAFLGTGIAAAEVVLDFDGGEAVSLQDLVEGQTIVFGDKVFSDWEYSATPGAPDAEDIYITPGYLNGNIAIRFQDTWQTGDAPIDSLITFVVSILPEYREWYIEDIEMYMPGAAADAGGSVSIIENVEEVLGKDKDGNLIIGKKVGGTYVYDFGGGVEKILDHTYFGDDKAYKSLKVTKDIGLIGPASMSVFYQGFSQIPEPMTLSVLVGGVLLALRRRK